MFFCACLFLWFVDCETAPTVFCYLLFMKMLFRLFMSAGCHFKLLTAAKCLHEVFTSDMLLYIMPIITHNQVNSIVIM
jgi:hypothetical protein